MGNKFLVLLDNNENLGKFLLPPLFGFLCLCSIFLDTIYLVISKLGYGKKIKIKNEYIGKTPNNKVAVFLIPAIFILFFSFLFFMSILFLLFGLTPKRRKIW